RCGMNSVCLVTIAGTVSEKLAEQYRPLRFHLSRSRRIVVAWAVEIDALYCLCIKLGLFPGQSRLAHRSKLHMTVIRYVGDVALHNLVRFRSRHAPEHYRQQQQGGE